MSELNLTFEIKIWDVWVYHPYLSLGESRICVTYELCDKLYLRERVIR